MKKRTYYDPLHLEITLDGNKPEEKMVMELIDSEPFQRLRRIRQLGPAFLTFHGAESSRFTHSLGVFHLARKAISRLYELDKSLQKHFSSLYIASLLHDLGHGPLSHTGEEIFGLKHELWTTRIINEFSPIRNIIESYNPKIIDNATKLILEKNYSNKIIQSLISSQLDCDRLDYLTRDSYSTGMKYGLLDLERILSALTISPDRNIAIQPKGIMAVEHYLVVRNLMYRSVYNHRINEICSWLLEQLIKNVRKFDPNKVWADEIMRQWIWSPQSMNVETYLANDDIRTTYHLQRWKDCSEKCVSELSKRFLNRVLPKAINISFLSNENQLECLAIARSLSSKMNIDPDILCGLRLQKIHSYHPYKEGLRIWDGSKLKALEEESSLVKGLASPAESAWLIYPKEVESKIKKEINKFI